MVLLLCNIVSLFLCCRTLFKLLYDNTDFQVIDVSFRNATEEIRIEVGSSVLQTLPYSTQWEQLVLVLQPRNESELEGSGSRITPFTNDAVSVTIYHNQIPQSNFTINEPNFPTNINSITVGDNFDGFIQDFGIYSLALGESGGSLVVPQEPDLLPQCLCPEGYQVSGGSCNPTGAGMSIMRYVV